MITPTKQYLTGGNKYMVFRRSLLAEFLKSLDICNVTLLNVSALSAVFRTLAPL